MKSEWQRVRHDDSGAVGVIGLRRRIMDLDVSSSAPTDGVVVARRSLGWRDGIVASVNSRRQSLKWVDRDNSVNVRS